MMAQLPREDIWRVTALQRRHTDYTITYDDYFREKNNA